MPDSDLSPENCLSRLGVVARQRREDLGLTQRQVASRSGIHRNYLSGIEHGERNVSMRNIVRLAAALELAPSQLLRRAERY